MLACGTGGITHYKKKAHGCKMSVRYILSSVWVRYSIFFSIIQYTICGAVCFQFTRFPCDDWDNIYTLSYYYHQIGSMNYYPLFRVRPWNNCMRCMSFYILMNSWYGRIASWDIRVLVVFAPNLVLSLTCSITTMLGTLLMIDAQHICTHWYILFPS